MKKNLADILKQPRIAGVTAETTKAKLEYNVGYLKHAEKDH